MDDAITHTHTHTHRAMKPREFILTALLLYSFTASAVLSQINTMYERELSTGQTIVCDRCRPGYRLQKHCTETQSTVCRPCAVGLYTEYWNYIYECLPCSLCSSDQVVVQECTSTRNRVCECKEGYFYDSYYCQPHSRCPSGYKVKTKGTPVKDTVCRRCQDGYYSNEHQSCVPHTKCKPDEKLLLHGTRHADNVCVTCSNIELNAGIYTGHTPAEHVLTKSLSWVKYIVQHFLLIFKNVSKSNSRRLNHFIGQLKNTKDCASNRDVCFQQLLQWFNKATEQDVSRLPKLLQEHRMKNLNTKIEQKIKRIQKEVRLCRNTLPDHK